jgi:hypothetical protein
VLVRHNVREQVKQNEREWVVGLMEETLPTMIGAALEQELKVYGRVCRLLVAARGCSSLTLCRVRVPVVCASMLGCSQPQLEQKQSEVDGGLTRLMSTTAAIQSELARLRKEMKTTNTRRVKEQARANGTLCILLAVL